MIGFEERQLDGVNRQPIRRFLGFKISQYPIDLDTGSLSKIEWRKSSITENKWYVIVVSLDEILQTSIIGLTPINTIRILQNFK